MRKQNLCIFIFQKLFIIAVTDNTTDCFVKGCLMLRLSKTVKKDKISISVYNSFTMNIKKLLSFFFHKECFFDEIQHRDLAFASRRFRGIDIKIAACASGMTFQGLFPEITYVKTSLFETGVNVIRAVSHFVTDQIPVSEIILPEVEFALLERDSTIQKNTNTTKKKGKKS